MIEIQLIAIIISIACSLVGTFLVLKKMSMITDSITHTILLGIILAFFITKDLNSPLLLVGATIVGVITVVQTEYISKINLVKEDAAIGLVFPFLFSIAIILISKYASMTHIDTDTVLLGELAFTSFNRLILFGIDFGAKALYSTSGILIVILIFIKAFFKEIQLTIFDPIFALTVGISPLIFHYAIMTLVSFTTVVAFESIGSVLVIAFMIGPPCTAYLCTNSLKQMLFLSSIFAIISAVLGLQFALILDVSIAGCMSVWVGIIFFIVFIFTKNKHR